MMPPALYQSLVRILMVLQWASSGAVIVACWHRDQTPTSLHYCLVLMATVCVLMSWGPFTAPQPRGEPDGAR
jgi:hypothetical protein